MPDKKNEPLRVEMELTKFMFAKMKDTFDLDVELLKGTVRDLPDGRIYVDVTLEGYKRDMFDDFIKMLMSKPSNQITTSILGMKIHQN
ncbi:hypothetical protein B0I27_10792 [Arcticibacter pallidicorallinus]|uniref:Uncharacterized protein n=1 Tax=Arcticibacter pallidicorallinus TaxID=1259464 RepID=A0A2T0U0N3_9SPHI|nr:hypothetical protein [Arcticibacter pallidicorallinus]PRY51506.1 hypothetical protein B0I27_10792 [Arcticibacter pallidicorallinus]